VTLLAGLMVADAYRTSYQVLGHVREAAAAVSKVRSELQTGHVVNLSVMDQAEAGSSAASLNVATAGPPFRLVGSIPILGRPVDGATLAALATAHEVDAAQIIDDLMGRVVGTGSQAPVFQHGAVSLPLIRQIGPELERLQSDLVAGQREIRAIPSFPFGGLNDQKATALDASQQAVRLATRALDVAKLLPSFLAPGDYLLTLQHGSATDPSGVLAYAVMSVGAHGQLSIVAHGELGLVPGDLRSGAAGTVAKTGPVWQRAMAKRGDPVRGVISLDPFAVAELIQDQPVRVPAYPAAITGRNVVTVLDTDLAHLPAEQGRRLAGQILDVASRRVLHPDPFLFTAQTLASAASEGHLVMWSAVPDQEQLIKQLEWGG